MADLPSILGGMAQGFIDFGKGAVDLFGTGGAAIGDAIDSLRTGKVSTKNQDDFRKWLYNTNDVQDAAAKGLGTALNGVQTVTDYIPGIGAVTKNPLFNAGQGALGGLADEFKTYGKDYDLGRAGERAAVSAGAALVSTGLADALKGSSNSLLKSATAQGLGRGAVGGAITGGGYAAIDGGDVMQGALQGAGTGALIGGATGAMQDFMPRKATYDMALTDDERQARIANAQKQIDDIGPVSRFSNNPDDIAKRARISELQGNIRAYENGYDTAQDYADAMTAKSANRANTQSATATQGQVYAPNMGEMEYGAPVQDGYTRLYRGMTQEFDPQYNRNAMDNMNGYESWTDNYDLANRYGDGKYVYSIDVPTSRIANSLYDENPNSATYGDRNFIAAIEKAAGLDDIDGNEYLLNTNDELRSGLTYNRVNVPRQLETTLSDADMAVNSPKLTPEQEAYFKDSVIRDENGNLIPMYHGTPDGSFTVFNEGSYFTPNKEYADGYQWEGASVLRSNKKAVNPKTFEVYIDSKKPFTLSDPKARDIYLNEYIKGGNSMYYDPYSDWTKAVKDLNEVDWTEGEDLRAWLKENHPEYDALYLDEGGDGGYGEAEYKWRGKSLIPFESNQIKDINNLAPTDAPDIMAEMIPDDMDLGRTLAGQDMAVNSAKIAPGQLGLFDDMPTQTPKTGTRQTSLFDQPQEGLDYYGDDIEMPVTKPTNPYAPVNGQVTQAMRDRAADILGNWKKNGVPENELYNAINPDTLPDKIKSLKEIVDDGAYDKRMKELFGTTDIKKADIGKVIDYLYDSEPSRAENIKNNLLAERGADRYEQKFRNRMKKGLYEAAQERIANDVGARGLTTSKSVADTSIRKGYTAAADEVLSERLGIAPGNTPKYNGAMDTRNAFGRYSHPSYREGGDLAVFERKMSSPEDAISTIAHERLHSFQGELEPRNNSRYDKEILDAYAQLRSDLNPYYKSWSETANRYGNRGTGYWQSIGEQESRMLQNYLENKGYTDSTHMKSKYRAGEWGNEINPAFDKFFDKLRDLSKRGVALPAITALLGGGAYMASQNNDKEKEVK